MEVYTIKNSSKEQISVIHFGVGLIGSAIKKEFLTKVYFPTIKHLHFPFYWSSKETHFDQVEKIFKECKFTFKASKSIIIIWSAGKAGFSASQEDTKEQISLFKAIVRLLSDQLRPIQVPTKFVLFSSAGGLFEGQNAVSKKTMPKPLRPYGVMKYDEERFLQESKLFDLFEIYRISTVYSIENLNHRKGLIQILMENGMVNKVSHIYGNQATLRDYVLDRDIARFIADRLYNQVEGLEVDFLINGKPSSIFEIQKSIEKVLNKKLYLVNSTVETNSMNISFLPSVMAKGFVSSNYRDSLRELKVNLNK